MPPAVQQCGCYPASREGDWKSYQYPKSNDSCVDLNGNSGGPSGGKLEVSWLAVKEKDGVSINKGKKSQEQTQGMSGSCTWFQSSTTGRRAFGKEGTKDNFTSLFSKAIVLSFQINS